MDRKGQNLTLSGLVTIALTMILAIVLIVVAVIIIGSIRDTDLVTADETRTVANNTITTLLFDETSYIVSGNIVPNNTDSPGVAGGMVDGTLIITNATTGEVVFDNSTSPNLGAGNFSRIDLVHGLVNLTDAAPIVSNDSLHIVNTSSNFNVSYSYLVPVRSEGYNASLSGSGFFTNLTTQFPLLGTIITLVSVISVIMAAFAFGRRGRGGGGL